MQPLGLHKLFEVRNYYLLFVFICFFSQLKGQTFSLKDLESQFLQNNLQLIANKFNISKAEALIVQEKLWQNPSLTVDNINLWSNKSFETMPNVIGNFGSKQQINMDIQQLIETAGKRKKRIAIKSLERNAAQFEFEELLRQLKLELRTNFHSLGRIQLAEEQLNNVYRLFSQLNEQYKIQSDKQHVSHVSYIRTNTELIGIQKELVDLLAEKNEKIQKLRILTQNPNLQLAELNFEDSQKIIETSVPIYLNDKVYDQNISLQAVKNDINLAEKQVELENAQKIPNINVLMNYERGGNVMSNFIGVGANIDLPIFNRNKGNIQSAKLQVEQNKATYLSKEQEISNEVDMLCNQLNFYRQNLNDWKINSENEHSKVLENYIKYLNEKQVTLLEFIDFSQAFRDAQQAYLELTEKYLITFEELQYTIGKDL